MTELVTSGHGCRVRALPPGRCRPGTGCQRALSGALTHLAATLTFRAPPARACRARRIRGNTNDQHPPVPLRPADEAAEVLDPDLHADLAEAQVWLLSWLPEQGTPLHDHGTSAGAFSVVRGSLTERVVAAGRSGVHETTDELTAGRVRHFGPHYVHQVTNLGAEPAISVPVHTPGLAWPG